DWIEAFGRAILEAMAAGVPVVLPYEYEPLFGDAAMYAPPERALTVVDELVRDPELYETQVRRARAAVEARFSYNVHAERLRTFLSPQGRLSENERQGEIRTPQPALVPSLLSCDGDVLTRERALLGKGGDGHLQRLIARLQSDA